MDFTLLNRDYSNPEQQKYLYAYHNDDGSAPTTTISARHCNTSTTLPALLNMQPTPTLQTSHGDVARKTYSQTLQTVELMQSLLLVEGHQKNKHGAAHHEERRCGPAQDEDTTTRTSRPNAATGSAPDDSSSAPSLSSATPSVIIQVEFISTAVFAHCKNQLCLQHSGCIRHWQSH